MRSIVWGNADVPVSQDYGVNLPNVPDSWYGYSADWGLNAGDHAGIDIAVPFGTPIFAAAAGIVSESGPSPWFRPNPVHVVTSDDPAVPGDDSEEHIYGHLSQNAVSEGDYVKRGQLLGYSGEQTISGTMTPDGSGPHLHFEERLLAPHKMANPTELLTGRKAVGTDDEVAGVTTLPATGDGGDIAGAIGRFTKTAGEFGARGGIAIIGVVAVGIGATIAFPQVRGGIARAGIAAASGGSSEAFRKVAGQ